MIFGLPPSEVAVHPSDKNGVHELFLMVDDVNAFIDEMDGHGIACGAPSNQGWGVLTELTLPGGGKLGVYEPRHSRPESGKAKSKPARRKAAKKTAKKTAKKAKRPPAKKAAKKRTAKKKSGKKKSRR